MSKLTRRGAFAALTGGVTATMLGPAFAASSQPEAGAPPATGLDKLLAAARATLHNTPPAHPDGRNAWATILLCRSWDHRIYLHVTDEVAGFALVTEEGLALATAAQAAGRKLAVHYWGHAPDGVGSFDGVLLAYDLRDLPVTT